MSPSSFYFRYFLGAASPYSYPGDSCIPTGVSTVLKSGYHSFRAQVRNVAVGRPLEIPMRSGRLEGFLRVPLELVVVWTLAREKMECG